MSPLFAVEGNCHLADKSTDCIRANPLEWYEITDAWGADQKAPCAFNGRGRQVYISFRAHTRFTASFATTASYMRLRFGCMANSSPMSGAQLHSMAA